MSALVAYTDPLTGDYTVLEFDIISGEEHTITAEVSDHPVEEGADVSDNVRAGLQRLSLRGVVTDSPINQVSAVALSGPLQGAFSPLKLTGRVSRQRVAFNVEGGQPFGVVPNGVPVIGGLAVPFNGFVRPATPVNVKPADFVQDFYNVSGSFLQFPTAMKRVRAAFTNLCGLCREGIPVEVSTDIRNYNRMLITSITAPRDGTDSIEFSIDLRELRTVKTQKTFVTRKPAAAKPAEKRAVPDVQKGKQAAPWRMDGKTSVAIIGQNTFQGTGPRVAQPLPFPLS